jgi:hypothetical protein
MKIGSRHLLGVATLALGACVVSEGLHAARGVEPGDPAGPTTVTSTDTTEPVDSGSEGGTGGEQDGGTDAQ